MLGLPSKKSIFKIYRSKVDVLVIRTAIDFRRILVFTEVMYVFLVLQLPKNGLCGNRNKNLGSGCKAFWGL